ncbi:hypothetical protein H2199_002313 [Coniosporium tulheliwenetii]|uniref:Uncharacterized protein n=1 Tax=Coniosporium tulheliwenetii TaxID=3383036 RepID=A0ACC2ZIF2_9PEZI|nr:hypothetical protein H2199_002313 [Cladosporium sp. JES 115]
MKYTQEKKSKATSTAPPRRSPARIAKQRSKRVTTGQKPISIPSVAQKKLQDYGAEIARLTLENAALKDAVERLQSETTHLGSGGGMGRFKVVVDQLAYLVRLGRNLGTLHSFVAAAKR